METYLATYLTCGYSVCARATLKRVECTMQGASAYGSVAVACVFVVSAAATCAFSGFLVVYVHCSWLRSMRHLFLKFVECTTLARVLFGV